MAKLTVAGVNKLLKEGKPGMTSDGQSLYFRITSSGGGGWIFRYRSGGKLRDMGLGSFPGIGLQDARIKAADARKLIASGRDPLRERELEREGEREAQRASEAKQATFERQVEDYIKAHGGAWSEKWRKGWLSKMKRYAFPVIGRLPASEIETEQVVEVLKPIWNSKPRTADEIRGQIEQVLDAAKALGWRKGENPARWRGHLDNLLSREAKKAARKRTHFPAMKWQELPALMAELQGVETLSSFAAQLAILTGARPHMARFARWDEFDLESRTWSLSIGRMKSRRAFVIPLADPVAELLRKIPRIEDSPFLFPGRGKSGVMHANAVRNLLHDMNHADITRHGFRSTFRDWAAERTNYPREICEMALAHDERDQTEGAYSRTDFLEKRRGLMADWASYAVSAPSDNVIQGAFGRQAQRVGD
ncbi:tyrosine-type recombinase/integrase [Pseudomonas aeruginosa]|uniref:tyrosine-type recombinase/integrase n=1 Tax=Pseudomonas aeruginosa TaxID=287 RepID=UPI0009364E91|nr:integrase arm-type DNA-binding domain-containing protein [Pseudomonas aeruginosa]HBP0077221.1 integrase arm-type DNA-binding domain-containing protein [Pseudomonas aeruginosa]